MANTSEKHKQKKSQKRKDRQERRRIKREEKKKQEYEKEIEKTKKQIEKIKTLRIKKSKKTLPGFLAKNAEVICQWLRSYLKLFMVADDAGLQSLERLSIEERHRMVQEYVDVSEFVDIVKSLMEVDSIQTSKKDKISDDEDDEDCISQNSSYSM